MTNYYNRFSPRPINTNFDSKYAGDFGAYQYVNMEDVIDNFMATYVGEGKLLERTLRADASFHGHRALQELSYDTLRSHKSQEIEIPPSLSMVLPHDYVNYVKLTFSDDSGIEHIIYPTDKTSNPTAIKQNDDGDYRITATATVTEGSAEIVLNEQRPDIRYGMSVQSEGTLDNSDCTVHEIEYGTSTTTITLAEAGDTTVCQCLWGTGASTNSQATFHFNYKFLILQQEETPVLLEGTSWPNSNATRPNAREIVITAASAEDAAKVKVGMIATNENLPTDNRVHSVQGNQIILTTNQVITAATGQDVVFYSSNTNSDTSSRYKSHTPSENNNDDYEDDTYWPNHGERYGLEPSHAQINGSFYIDYKGGKIHFSSNLSGKTVILKYISDGIDTSDFTSMLIPKLAEEAIYKWMAYGCASARTDLPEYIIRRLKKERFAETRKAKLRLSNIKLEEISQILRGKSKQIKH